MTILEKLKRVMFSSGLSKQEYRLIENRICQDNRDKLASGSLVVFAFLFVMLILSYMVESLSHSQNVYLISLICMLVLYGLSVLGKESFAYSTVGIYLFTDLALCFGIYQGIVTSPQEHTSSFMALVLAIPFWFGMIPFKMISSIVLFTILFVVGAAFAKTGAVRTADIVNAIIYSSASCIISTYATCSKCKRFYAEYLTEQAGKTDSLTKLGNRRAFSDHIQQYAGETLPDPLTVWYFDVNELKFNNDTFGHQAGDELLRAAADCMVSVFGDVGTCYRTGGDEFVVIGEANSQTRAALCHKFEQAVAAWKNPSGMTLRVSYGCASSYELSDHNIQSVISLADKRLYDAKDIYYRTEGIGRRGHEPAVQSLSSSCIVIIKADLTNDTFRRLQYYFRDELSGNTFVDGFAQCLKELADSDRIHPDDVEKYREKTQLDFLRSHFRSGKQSLHIFYRRKIDGQYYSAMTELIAASDYTDEQQLVYLYVKLINE